MGRKLIYGEITILISFRVPKSKEKEIRKLIQHKLDEYAEENRKKQN